MSRLSFNIAELHIDTWSGSYGFTIGFLTIGKKQAALFSIYLFLNELAQILRIEILGAVIEVGKRTPPPESASALST